MTVKFKVKRKTEIQLIDRIAKRGAGVLAPELRPAKRKAFERDLSMDVTACHCNGCRLDLQKLIDFDENNFLHDVAGIRRHLDRSTGKLKDCFLPRCALP